MLTRPVIASTRSSYCWVGFAWVCSKIHNILAAHGSKGYTINRHLLRIRLESFVRADLYNLDLVCLGLGNKDLIIKGQKLSRFGGMPKGYFQDLGKIKNGFVQCNLILLSEIKDNSRIDRSRFQVSQNTATTNENSTNSWPQSVPRPDITTNRQEDVKIRRYARTVWNKGESSCIDDALEIVLKMRLVPNIFPIV